MRATRIAVRWIVAAMALAVLSPALAQAPPTMRPPIPPQKPGPADFEGAAREMSEREKTRPQAVKPRTAQDAAREEATGK